MLFVILYSDVQCIYVYILGRVPLGHLPAYV